MHYEYKRLDKEEAEVISMEEYLAKRKKIREDERKHKKKAQTIVRKSDAL
ncbi:MAG: hypothetical protein ACLR2O_05590 [Coprococcus sp.]